jgi:hypothetical protein
MTKIISVSRCCSNHLLHLLFFFFVVIKIIILFIFWSVFCLILVLFSFITGLLALTTSHLSIQVLSMDCQVCSHCKQNAIIVLLLFDAFCLQFIVVHFYIPSFCSLCSFSSFTFEMSFSRDRMLLMTHRIQLYLLLFLLLDSF